jgi:hypothetical protein
MEKNLKIPCPTKSEMKKYLAVWDKVENFYKPKKAMTKLFNHYRTNMDIDDILIKIYTLNAAYSASIFWPIDVAKNILDMKIDNDLRAGDLAVVDKIRTGHGVRNRQGAEINFYSFATKYCSFHNPDKYPLFDSNVKRALIYFKEHCTEQFTFNNTDLGVYKAFVDIIRKFQETFYLQDSALRDIDKYLYLIGRELNGNLSENKL